MCRLCAVRVRSAVSARSGAYIMHFSTALTSSFLT